MMKKTIRKLLPTLLLGALGVGSTAHAGELFGLGQQSKFLAASAFQPVNEACRLHFATPDYQYASVVPAAGQTSCINPSIVAQLELPEGSQFLFQRLYYYNTTNSALTIYLWRYSVDAVPGTNPRASRLTTTTVTAATGYATNTLGMPSVITFDSNQVKGEAVQQQVGYGYAVYLPPTSMIRGVETIYRRQIAPAPATASFTDIPTSHPFFNEVEQLKKSGITLGCGNDQFCPDSPVTRGQMAAFLSRALGLQWDTSTDAS